MRRVRLGLIGDNIRASRAPRLHRLCGEICGLDVRYRRYVPAEMGLSFDGVLCRLAEEGLCGVNVTHPYKETAFARVAVDAPGDAALGAVNTVLFGSGGPRGFNTDHSGFLAAYRAMFGDAASGRTVLIGAGGVGRAVGFALVRLGAQEIVVLDADRARAQRLAAALGDAGGPCGVAARVGDLGDLDGTDGVLNCTPLGMDGHGGSPVPEGRFPAARWAFDAVYTPPDTPFSAQAIAAGAAFLPGFELFLHQGLDAFALFTGIRIGDAAALRARLGAHGGVPVP